MSIIGRLEGAIGLRFTSKRVFRSEEIELAQALANQAMLAMRLTRLYVRRVASRPLSPSVTAWPATFTTTGAGLYRRDVQLEAAADATSKGLPKESQEHCARAADLARESWAKLVDRAGPASPHSGGQRPIGSSGEPVPKNTATTGLHASFHCPRRRLQLANGWDESFLRIAQESLTNTIHHADATQFHADLFFDNDEVRLDLQDNGRGFDVSAQHAGFGLLGIGERVEQMGGRLTIRSGAGDGTALSVRVPLPPEHPIGVMPE